MVYGAEQSQLALGIHLQLKLEKLKDDEVVSTVSNMRSCHASISCNFLGCISYTATSGHRYGQDSAFQGPDT